MAENLNPHPNSSIAAAPVIKERRPLSIVWLVPLIALIIGGWLIYKAVTEKGVTITISFNSADGIEAGKTKVKYKDVEVGVVKSIHIGENLSQVILTVEMKKGADPYLTEKTQFWVVRARVTASQISGLQTLLGGVYIGIEPSSDGEPTLEFKGLEIPPIVTGDMKGKRFSLIASQLGSLNPGSPIYFRQIQVGQVVNYKLDEGGDHIGVDIFVESPYHQFVSSNTRFWNTSGLNIKLTANGLEVETSSLVALMIGGISFNTFTSDSDLPEAEDNSQFKLYRSQQEARDDRYTSKEEYYIEFKESVRGLSVGAPVDFRGFRIGTVVDIELQSDIEKLEFVTLVRISMERKRISLPAEIDVEVEEKFYHLLKKGFRAQLKTGNLLTGQLFVGLDFYDDAPSADITSHNDLFVIPSVPSPSQTIMKDVARIMKKLDELPLSQIGRDLQSSMEGLDRLIKNPDIQKALRLLKRIMAELQITMQTLNSDTVPQVNASLSEMENLLKEMGSWVNADSPLYEDVRRALDELARAARAINDLADMLERHPEALIQGKTNEDR